MPNTDKKLTDSEIFETKIKCINRRANGQCNGDTDCCKCDLRFLEEMCVGATKIIIDTTNFSMIPIFESEKENLIKKIKAEAYKEFADKLNIEAEKVEIDREGDFVETGNKIYDTVANWCKATTDNLLKELVGNEKCFMF